MTFENCQTAGDCDFRSRRGQCFAHLKDTHFEYMCPFKKINKIPVNKYAQRMKEDGFTNEAIMIKTGYTKEDLAEVL